LAAEVQRIFVYVYPHVLFGRGAYKTPSDPAESSSGGAPDDRDGPEMAKRLLRSETGTLDLAAAFLEADTDKSGTLDKEQFKHVLSVVGIDGADEQQIATIMAMVDLNKDGCVDYAEFTDWVTTKMPSMKVKTTQVLHADVHEGPLHAAVWGTWW
jgi:hypothetical protein